MIKIIFLSLVAIACIYEAFVMSPAISSAICILLGLWFYHVTKNRDDDTALAELEEHGQESFCVGHTGYESDDTDNYTYYDDYYDFPEPDVSDPGMIPDPQMCLGFVAKYENLAERARACGYDDLADQYEAAADHWRYLYEEAEDEEMEW